MAVLWLQSAPGTVAGPLSVHANMQLTKQNAVNRNSECCHDGAVSHGQGSTKLIACLSKSRNLVINAPTDNDLVSSKDDHDRVESPRLQTGCLMV